MALIGLIIVGSAEKVYGSLQWDVLSILTLWNGSSGARAGAAFAALSMMIGQIGTVRPRPNICFLNRALHSHLGSVPAFAANMVDKEPGCQLRVSSQRHERNVPKGTAPLPLLPPFHSAPS